MDHKHREWTSQNQADYRLIMGDIKQVCVISGTCDMVVMLHAGADK